MKTNKYSSSKNGTASDVDRFCQSVEQVLTDIKEKRTPRSRKKKREENSMDLVRQIITRRG